MKKRVLGAMFSRIYVVGWPHGCWMKIWTLCLFLNELNWVRISLLVIFPSLHDPPTTVWEWLGFFASVFESHVCVELVLSRRLFHFVEGCEV